MGESIVSKKLKFGDAFAALFVIALAFAIFAFLPKSNSGNTVYITTQNHKYAYSVFDDREVKLSENGIDLTVIISNGEVFVESSTCPDGICTSSGKLRKNGCIVCVPAKVIIELDSEEVDAVAG